MQPPMPPTPESARIAAPAGEAVARILACADMAVSAIERQAEQRVRELRDERAPEHEALQRQARLELLRTDLTDRAVALADSWRAINEELEAVDRMLAAIGHGSAHEASPAADPPPAADPRVAAIKMTLRERQRIQIGPEAAPAPAAPRQAPWHYEAPAPETRYLEAPAYYQEQAPRYEEPAPAYEYEYEAPVAPRRAWLPWQRAA